MIIIKRNISIFMGVFICITTPSAYFMHTNETNQQSKTELNLIQLCNNMCFQRKEYDTQITNEQQQSLAFLLSQDNPLLLDERILAVLFQKAIEIQEKKLDKECINHKKCSQELKNNDKCCTIQAQLIVPDSKIICISDLHGAAHSIARILIRLHLNGYLNDNGILKENTYIIITGDMVDRGHYNLETLAIVFFLFILNPNQVVILQGNHENEDLACKYGFYNEFLKQTKYLSWRDIFYLFSLLPQVLLLGTQAHNDTFAHFLLFCHGGIEDHRYKQTPNHVQQAIKSLLIKATEDHLKDAKIALIEISRDNGFLWNSFYAHQSCKHSHLKGNRTSFDIIHHGDYILTYLENISQENTLSVDAIIRGHDHLPYGISALHCCQPDNQNSSQWIPIGPKTPVREIIQQGGYPIYTITSSAELTQKDSYAVLTYLQETSSWYIQGFRYPSDYVKQAYAITSQKTVPTFYPEKIPLTKSNALQRSKSKLITAGSSITRNKLNKPIMFHSYKKNV